MILSSLKASAPDEGSASPQIEGVIFFFSPKCVVCTRQFPLWEELTRKLDGKIPVLGLTSDEFAKEEIADYLASLNIGQLEALAVPKDVLDSLQFKVTPITIAVGNGGVIRKAWVGGWLPEVTSEIGNFFSVDALTTPNPFATPQRSTPASDGS